MRNSRTPYPQPSEKYPKGPLGPNPANDTVVRAGDVPTDSLHDQNLRVQRRSRIERRRQRIAYLQQFVANGDTATEIGRLQDEIRAEGEEP
jgi:hypothetical protein